MKKLRITLTLAAFACAIVAAVAHAFTASQEPGLFGYASTGICAEASMIFEEDCSVNNSGAQCTVWIEGSLENGPSTASPAYEERIHTGLCSTPLYSLFD